MTLIIAFNHKKLNIEWLPLLFIIHKWPEKKKKKLINTLLLIFYIKYILELDKQVLIHNKSLSRKKKLNTYCHFSTRFIQKYIT